MSEFDNDETLVQDELTTLKARATLLGLSFHPSIGLEKLREKVNAAATGTGEDTDTSQEPKDKNVPAAKVFAETPNEKRGRLKREASALVRLRVTCMNPAKSEWEGEIFTAGNSAVGSLKKYVPFNAEEGWHVPNIIYQMMKERQCQIFHSVKDGRGNLVRKGRLIKEFAIEVMPPLTREELDEMARRQAMAKSID